jgi:hypothetical protein
MQSFKEFKVFSLHAWFHFTDSIDVGSRGNIAERMI